jgi:hypothetical protein
MSKRKVAIFGAGIGGLTVAHELSKLDQANFEIDVYELKDHIGGLARSSRDNPDGCATEYCWRVFFGFYKNMFKILDEISPNGDQKNLFTTYKHINLMDPQPIGDMIRAYYGILRGLMSCDERLDDDDSTPDSHGNKGLTWASVVSPDPEDANLFKTVGPWLGADRVKCSYRSVIKVGIEQQILPSYLPGYKDYVTTAPTSDVIFDPWQTLLESRGVKFHFRTALDSIKIQNSRVVTAKISSSTHGQGTGAGCSSCARDTMREINSDIFILALPIEALEKVLQNSIPMGLDSQEIHLKDITTLRQECLHTQLSFQLYFNEKVSLGGSNAFLLVESSWDLIVLSYDQAYSINVDDPETWICSNNKNIKGAWSVAATTAYRPGSTGKTLAESSYAEIIQELWVQLSGNLKLQTLIKANNPFDLDKSIVVGWSKLWPTFTGATVGKSTGATVGKSTGATVGKSTGANQNIPLHTTEPKFTNNAGSYHLRPSFKTYIPNLFIATAYVKETIDIFSMEAACLAGILVSHHIDPRSSPPHILARPALFAPFRALDRVCWYAGAPNSLTTMSSAVILLILFTFTYIWYKR